MNDLVSIDGDRITVSGRLLHERLGIQTKYADWFPRACEQCGLTEGKDFLLFVRESTGGRPATDHQLTTRAAKKIAARTRTVRGNDALEYLLDVEDKISARPESTELLLSRAIIAADKVIKEQAAQNEKLAAQVAELKPKADFADAYTATDGCANVSEVAKMLTQAGYPIGQNRLFDWLVTERPLFRNGHGDYEPYQRVAEMGIFRVVKNVITNPKRSFVSTTVKVTPKGQKYLLGRFAPDGGLPLMIAGTV